MKNSIYILLIFVSLVFTLVYFQKIEYNNKFKHIIEDKFTVDQDNTKLFFYFVEVSEYDKKKIYLLSIKLLDNLKETEENNGVLISYFYSENDLQTMDEDQKSIILKMYPKKPNLIKNLSYYPNGFIFSGSTSDEAIVYRGKKISSGKLIQSEVIIPKKGTNAYFILFN